VLVAAAAAVGDICRHCSFMTSRESHDSSMSGLTTSRVICNNQILGLRAYSRNTRRLDLVVVSRGTFFRLSIENCRVSAVVIDQQNVKYGNNAIYTVSKKTGPLRLI